MTMKKYLFAAAAMLFLLVGCEPKQKVSSETEIAAYSDSTALLMFNVDVELPIAADEVNANVRRDLLDVVVENFSKFGYEESVIGHIEGVSPELDIQTLVDKLGSEVFVSLGKLAEADYEDRMRSGAGREFALEFDFDEHYDFQWECMSTLSRILDADKYWVYLSEDYVYMGGAHGGIGGAGYLTYSKEDGSRITGFLDPSKLDEIQPILRQGIVRFFDESGEDISEDEVIDYLFIEDGIIPFPAYEPYPTEDGLNFIYQQYEIAPYAMGMPSFTVPFSEIKPFLSESARKALGL